MIKFQFIGGIPSQKTFKRNSFVIQITEEEFERIKTFPYPRFMEAEVIESKLTGRFVGEKSNCFINPFLDMHTSGWPVFVRIWE